MFSKHSKECSLAQLSISNEFMLPLLSHRRITRLSKQLLLCLLSKFSLLSHSEVTFRTWTAVHIYIPPVFRKYEFVVGMFLSLSFVYPLWVHCYELSCICTFVSSLLHFHIIANDFQLKKIAWSFCGGKK